MCVCVCVYLYLFYIYFFSLFPTSLKINVIEKKILLIYYIEFLLVACTIYLFISIFFENIWTKIEILSFCWQDMYLSCIMWSKKSVVLKLSTLLRCCCQNTKFSLFKNTAAKTHLFSLKKRRIEQIVQSNNFCKNSIKKENISLKKNKSVKWSLFLLRIIINNSYNKLEISIDAFNQL